MIYNLNPWSRARLAEQKTAPVFLEAGYRPLARMTLFAGEMREAFSRAEPDGTWATVLRAGDGDDAITNRRNSLAVRPGVSIERVLEEQLRTLGVGMGNAITEIRKQITSSKNLDAKKLQKMLSTLGTNAVGNSSKIAQRLLAQAGMEVSVQNGQLQVLGQGQVLGVRATILTPHNGLEGVPELDREGNLHCRARLLPGLVPGYPLQVLGRGSDAVNAPDELYPEMDPHTVYRIERVRYVGDTHGHDWNAEIEARDVKLGPKEKKKARRK